jgi:xanthine/uracil/vitamin C permease (AzgA family)
MISSVRRLTFLLEGGKTGLTAITTGIMFFFSIFFAPIFSSIPPWAKGGALMIVGTLMIRKLSPMSIPQRMDSSLHSVLWKSTGTISVTQYLLLSHF